MAMSHLAIVIQLDRMLKPFGVSAADFIFPKGSNDSPRAYGMGFGASQDHGEEYALISTINDEEDTEFSNTVQAGAETFSLSQKFGKLILAHEYILN